MADGRNFLLLSVYLVVFGLLAFIVTAEVAFNQVREDRLERLVQRRVPGARRLAALQQSHESLAFAIVIIRSTFNAILAISGFIIALRLVESEWGSIPLGLLLSVGGGILAQGAGRVWGRLEPEKIALTLVPLGILMESTLEPLTSFVVALYRPLMLRLRRRRRAAVSTNGEAAEAPAPDLDILEDPSQPTPEEKWERQVIRGVMRLESTTVREIMVPRPDIVAIDVSASLDQAVALILHQGYSRIPLYRGTIDNVAGVLYARDLLGALRRDRPITLEELARVPLLVPETKRLDDLLREFQQKRVQVTLVVDEYGAIAGLVTTEDLLEEIVGEIEDEFAVREPPVERINDDAAIMDARTPLSTVNDLFGTDLQAEGFDTLGGLIYHRLGHVPQQGETITHDGVQLAVLSTSGRRIRRVQVTRTHRHEDEE